MACVKVSIVVLNKPKNSGLALFKSLEARVSRSGRTGTRVADAIAFIDSAIAEVGADPIVVEPDDTLCWESEGEDFWIRFSKESPFQNNEKQIPSIDGKTECLPIKHHGHSKPIPPKRRKPFHYTISLARGRELLTLDPEVIIEDGC